MSVCLPRNATQGETGWEEKLTSFSPTSTCTTLPFGTTCATSLKRTFAVLVLSGCTRKFSSSSGLNLPPARSLDRSSLRRSTAAAMSASRAEKSAGSSVEAASFWEADWDLDSSRAALAPFLRREGVVLKGRRGERYCCCWSGGRLVVRVVEACLGGLLVGRCCYCRRGTCVTVTCLIAQQACLEALLILPTLCSEERAKACVIVVEGFIFAC